MTSDYSTDEILKFAIENGIVDLSDIKAEIDMMNRRKYLEMHKYKIFLDKKDNRWKTTIPDKMKKSGRRLIAKKTEKELLDFVAKYYMDQEVNASKLDPDITMAQLYPIWIKSRMLEVNSTGTAKKNDQDWRRYYEGTKIVNVPMRYLSINDLRDWAHKIIDTYHMNKKAYYNMALLIKKMFIYASDDGVCENTWGKVRINTKKLRPNLKKGSDTQIYFDDEKKKITDYAYSLFEADNRKITALIIPLLFVTGLRVGEVVALKYEDIYDGNFHVEDSEVTEYSYDEKKEKFVFDGRHIADHAKTEAGRRTVPYTKIAKEIIETVRKASLLNGFYDEGYIFCPRSRRLKAGTVTKKLYKYCDRLGIDQKSAHKIRKTYISKIIQSGVDIDTVCRVSGHRDIKTTLDSYCYSLNRDDEIHEEFENIFVAL